ncbi:MAG: FtsX-like permease family protein [Steroidobacteraceae bacterium]
MEIGPILSALRRSPTGAILVALQIALALAITVNACFITVDRLKFIHRDPGLDVANTFVIAFAARGRDFDAATAMREDLAVLRALPGVVAATPINAVPLSGGGSGTSYYTEPGEKGRRGEVNYFQVDEHGIETLGVELSAGRNFDASVVKPSDGYKTGFVAEVVMTEALANQLFPGQSAVGKTIYDNLGEPAKVVGTIKLMHGSWPGWENVGNVSLQPTIPNSDFARYMVRAKPGQRDEVMKLAEEKLSAIDNGRIITKVRSLEEYASRSYADDRAMAIYMVIVIALLVGVAALGVFGLAAFNVSTRTKQIGTRRAVGARRRDVVRYFLVENWLVTTTGVLAGCVLALGLGYWLSAQFELPRLPLWYLVGGVAALWTVGLGAAMVPARRASHVSPAVATRTV